MAQPEHEEEKGKEQQKYVFHSVEVEFPFKAYECQRIYMEKVIEALEFVMVLLVSWKYTPSTLFFS